MTERKEDLSLEDLSEKIRSALSLISSYDETGLKSEQDALSRFKGVSEKDSSFIVEIASDELDLNHKLALEQALKEKLSASLEDSALESVVIFFKRHKAANVANKSRLPEPNTAARSGVFGIKQDKRAIPGVRRIIAVASGKGGVGKSTVSVNLAVAMAKLGHKVGLLDADIYGPSAPLMLGLSGGLEVSSDKKMLAREAYGIKCMSFGFMSDPQNPVIWRGPMVSKALSQLFYDTAWGELDYLFLDLPPGTGDVQLTMIEKLPLFGGVVVSTPQNVALLDAHKGITMFKRLGVEVLGLVENMSYFSCPNCSHEEKIFGEAIEAFSLEQRLRVLAKIPIVSKLRQAADEGRPMASQEHELSQVFLQLASSLAELS